MMVKASQLGELRDAFLQEVGLVAHLPPSSIVVDTSRPLAGGWTIRGAICCNDVAVYATEASQG